MIIRQFFTQTIMELRLLLKLQWPLLLPFGAGLWMLINTHDPVATASQDVNVYANSEHSTILLLTTIVPILLGVYHHAQGSASSLL